MTRPGPEMCFQSALYMSQCPPFCASYHGLYDDVQAKVACDSSQGTWLKCPTYLSVKCNVTMKRRKNTNKNNKRSRLRTSCSFKLSTPVLLEGQLACDHQLDLATQETQSWSQGFTQEIGMNCVCVCTHKGMFDTWQKNVFHLTFMNITQNYFVLINPRKW